MNILLTGGTGTIGTTLVATLAAAGHRLTALCRTPGPAAANVQWIATDLGRDGTRVLDGLPAPGMVLHNAACKEMGANSEELRRIRELNIDFTESLWHWAGSRGVPTVIFISGFNLLRRPLARTIEEDHPVAASDAYGLSKLWGEIGLTRCGAQYGFRAVALRATSPICFDLARLPHTVVRRWIEAARDGKPITVFGQGERTQNFVAVEDIAQAVLRSLDRSDASGVFNVGSHSPLSMRDLAQLIGAAFKVDVTFQGTDPLEEERWNVSIARARAHLGYEPAYSSRTAIETLLSRIP